MSINLNVSSSLSVSNYTNISVKTSFKVDPSESIKINVIMIGNTYQLVLVFVSVWLRMNVIVGIECWGQVNL